MLGAFRARTVRAFGSLIGARVVGKVVGGLSAILLARTLGPAGFGQLAGALAIVALATSLVQGATDSAALRVLALHEGRAPALLRSIVGAKLWVGLLLALVATACASPFVPPLLVLLLGVNALFVSLAGVVQTRWVAREEQWKAAFAEVARGFGWLLAAAAVALAAWGPVGAAASRVVATALLGVWLFRAVSREADLRPSLRDQSAVLRDASPFLLSGLFFIVYQEADRVMLLAMVGERETGMYASAASLVAVFTLIPTVFTTVFLPRMYRDSGKPHQQGRLLGTRLTAGLLMGSLVVPLLVAFREPLLTFLYGASFAAGAPVLLWLSLAMLLRFASISYGDMITAADRQGLRAAIQGGAAVLNIGLNLLLIPRWGAVGAAAATLAAEMALLVGYVLAVRSLSMPTRSRLLLRGTSLSAAVTAMWLWQPWVGAATLVAIAVTYGVRRRRLSHAAS